MQQPPVEEQLIDLSRPERQQTALAPAMTEGEYFEPAMRGEAWAQTKLGKAYVASADDPLRVQQGVQLLRQAAEQNDAEALYVLATLSAAGVGVEQSETNAFEQMKRAAELGWAEAQFELAVMYFEGRGVGRDEPTAELWLRKSADQDYIEAQSTLGRALLMSAEADKQAEGERYLKKLSDSGHAPSVIFLADAIGNGKFGLTKDEIKAEAFLKPLAEQGNADCQFLLAALYKFGDSFTDRRNDALPLIEKAARQGHPDALQVLTREGL